MYQKSDFIERIIYESENYFSPDADDGLITFQNKLNCVFHVLVLLDFTTRNVQNLKNVISIFRLPRYFTNKFSISNIDSLLRFFSQNRILLWYCVKFLGRREHSFTESQTLNPSQKLRLTKNS